MPATQTSDLRPQVSPNSPKAVIWVVNPFDQLPNETDVPRRYWPIARILAEKGHNVIWWSSDFSHLTKTKRAACGDTDGFSIRLIQTDPYSKNISFARLRNHRQFAQGFKTMAREAIRSGELAPPDRIVVSTPPLGVAENAFIIRDYINSKLSARLNSTTTSHCEVVVDIKDAWPETFYQAIPKSLRKILGPILFSLLHRSAKHAYQGADKISAVGKSYLDLAQRYLGDQSSPINNQSSQAKPVKPMHLCYHGTDLNRFEKNMGGATFESSATSTPNKQQTTNNPKPLKAVYLGSMGSGYDLMTIIEVAARWKAENIFPFQIHFAGSGSQLEALKAESRKWQLIEAEPSNLASLTSTPDQFSTANCARIVFHGYIGKAAITKLCQEADLALVPNRPDSLVACPAKICELAAAQLPMLSCLEGELWKLLSQWSAGSEYKEGDSASLHAAFEKYSNNLVLLKKHSLNARKMAEALFDRSQTYTSLAEFIIS